MTKHDHPTWPEPPEANAPVAGEEAEAAPANDAGEAGLADQLAQALAERDDFLDQLQRSRAEFINFKRRSDQERTQVRQFVARDILAQFLPVIDDFDRALAMVPDDERETGWLKGIALIQDKLTSTAERLGAVRVDALGHPFDPSMHEAVATEPGSTGSTVVEVYQNGYRIGDMLVRPAMVKTGDPIAADDAAEPAFNA